MMHDLKNGWYNMNIHTGQHYGFCKSKSKCEAQLRLLRGVEHGLVLKGKKRFTA